MDGDTVTSTTTASDITSAYMRIAFAQAEEALAADEIPVGCVFVHGPSGVVLGRGRNRTNETVNVEWDCECDCDA